MKIAGAALNQTPLDWNNNLRNILDAIALAQSKKVDVLCLPELVITGYGCEDMFLHPWVAERSLLQLEKIIQACQKITVAIGLPMWFEQKLYNVICLVQDQKIIGFHAKQNMARDGVHYEPRWFSPWTPGQTATVNLFNKSYPFGDRTYQIDEAIIGFEICEDAWVENRPACRLAALNVNLILNPSASHFALEKIAEREELVVKSSAEFNCTYLYANQLGNEAGRIIYDGDVVIAQHGKLLASAKTLTLKDIQFVACDVIPDSEGPPTLHELNIASHASTYQEFTNAVVLGLHDYLRKSKSNGFVISLSGGADSSSCLVLATEMIRSGIATYGLEQFLRRINRADLINQVRDEKETVGRLVSCAYQSSKNSSSETQNAARVLAESVGATFYQWSIEDEVNNAQETIERAVGRQLTWAIDDIALQNIQARVRSPIIWMLANIQNALLITTSNRSEGSVGYTTMDGDTSGSIAPLAGIDKPFLLSWLKWMQSQHNYAGLTEVLDLAPTAELRPPDNQQTDEDDLMPYKILTRIEELFVYERQSPLQIYNQLKQEEKDLITARQISRFFQLWSRNQWKRERLAPSFQLSKFNIDSRSWFRFPILSGGFEEELQQINDLLV